MDKQGEKNAHQLSRITGRVLCSEEFCEGPSEMLCPFENGQRVSSEICKQTGRSALKALADLAKEFWHFCLGMNIMIQAQCLPGESHSVADWKSRQQRFQRLGFEQGSVLCDKFSLGSDGGGPVCKQSECANPKILQLEAGSSSVGSRCFFTTLGGI